MVGGRRWPSVVFVSVSATCPVRLYCGGPGGCKRRRPVADPPPECKGIPRCFAASSSLPQYQPQLMNASSDAQERAYSILWMVPDRLAPTVNPTKRGRCAGVGKTLRTLTVAVIRNPGPDIGIQFLQAAYWRVENGCDPGYQQDQMTKILPQYSSTEGARASRR